MKFNKEIPGRTMLGAEHLSATNKRISSMSDDAVPEKQSRLEFNPAIYEVNEWCPIYPVGRTQNGGTIWKCAITDSIVMLHEYVPLLNKLYEATPNDIIQIDINSPGGYISTATQICTAIKSCRGKVLTHAAGMCASAGSLIWSVGHECTVGDLALFMWHMSSHADMGNSLGIRDEAEFQISYVRDILLGISVTRGYITQDELERICTNPDDAVWITAEEMRSRISKEMRSRSKVPGAIADDVA